MKRGLFVASEGHGGISNSICQDAFRLEMYIRNLGDKHTVYSFRTGRARSIGRWDATKRGCPVKRAANCPSCALMKDIPT